MCGKYKVGSGCKGREVGDLPKDAAEDKCFGEMSHYTSYADFR